MNIEQKHRLQHKLFQRAKGRCEYCGRRTPFKVGTIDHYVPKLLGGPNTFENTRWCCMPCNAEKGSMTPRDWERILAARAPAVGKHDALAAAIRREREKAPKGP